MNIIIAVLVLAVLVIVHEWGHFIAARKIGIPVHEFSVGFGPALYSRKRNGVLYSLRVIPLGGYVKMAGEGLEDLEAEDGFAKRKPWEKVVVALAGPLMNFVFAVLVFIFLFAGIGVPHANEKPIIGGVVAGQPASVAGLQSDDLILGLNEEPVATWLAFTDRLSALPVGAEALLEIDRGGQVFTVTLSTVKNDATGRSMIGVTNQVVYEKQGLLSAVKSGLVHTYTMSVALLGGLVDMVSGAVNKDDIAGPLGIITMIGDTARAGLVSLLSFTGFLSINLGILNLLPIPALDGSKVLFAFIESIRRKPIPLEKEAMVTWIGFLFLMGLILFATYNDLVRLFSA
jgi:regulator of sigma E protease